MYQVMQISDVANQNSGHVGFYHHRKNNAIAVTDLKFNSDEEKIGKLRKF